MHRLTATDTPMVRYTRTIFPSYAESFLYLYPSAIKYYDSIKYNQQKVSNKQLKQMETFYGILIDIVNDWMKVLLKDEIVIIKYKYFNCLNYTQIAIETNYSNHSSIIKKKDKILAKIQHYRRYYI